MKKMIVGASVCLLALGCSFPGMASEARIEEDKWDRAGREIVEAAGAVSEAARDTTVRAWRKTREESVELYGEAREESAELLEKARALSAETWDKFKKDSAGAWEETRKGSRQAFERARSVIHEATAPDPEPLKE